MARRVGDRRVLKLIRRYLDAGVMVSGVKVATVEGTPQGWPLSPLLANIMLDDLDHELERRGHTFVRYADDLRVSVASERAAARVLEGVTVFVEQRRKRRVNRTRAASHRRPSGACWASASCGATGRSGCGSRPGRSIV